jgi:hypothetical protein
MDQPIDLNQEKTEKGGPGDKEPLRKKKNCF